MKFVKSVLALACGLGLAVSVQAAPQHAHDDVAHAAEHDTAHSAAHNAVPVPAQRWTPDAPLREGIRRAHVAVDQLSHHEKGHMSTSMTVDRAAEVEQAVMFMFTNCKLNAEPDAALHGVLVPLLTAAQSLKADPENIKPVAEMREALSSYPRYFNDPGWDKPAVADTQD